jgi:NAD(P) transhydrogenase
MEDRFDMVVIGAGPAGEKAAAQAAYFGKRVAIVERQRRLGGAAAQNGGIPTKTLREAALYVTGFRRRDIYGVGIDLPPHKAVKHLWSRVDEIVSTVTSSVSENIERHGVALIRGTASLAPDRNVLVESPDGTRRLLEAEAVLIATGSRPFHPPGVDFDDPDVLDSESVIGLDTPVSSVVVVGGGAVGCEYASIFAALGAKVTLVDSGARLIPFMDAEISKILKDSLGHFGVRVLLDAGRAAVLRDEQGLRVTLASGEVLRPDKVLFAAGRAGNTEALGLDKVGVKTDERGRILVDHRFQTTAPGIYAAGDVIGPPALASVSMEQGRVAACHAFGIPFKQTVDSQAPFGIYSIPEVAMVGLSEEAAAGQGLDYEVGRGWFARNTRANIIGATEGLVKLVFQRDDRRLLGVHIIGGGAAELIHQGQAVLRFGGDIEYFIHTTFNVPTESEAYKYAAYDGLQRLARIQAFADT